MSVKEGSGGTGEWFKAKGVRPGAAPSVLLVPDQSGLTDSVRRTAAMLSSAGYQVLAMDPYDGISPEKSVLSGAWVLPAAHDKNIERIEYALVFLENWMMDASRIAIVGWREGATLAADAAVAEENVKVLVVYDGQLPLDPDSIKRLKAVVVGSFNGTAPTVDGEQIEAFQTSMKRAHKPLDLKVYSGASVGFDDGANPEAYRAADAADARKRMMAWFARTLK